MPHVAEKWKYKYQKCLENLAFRLVEDTGGGRENNGVVVYAIYLLIKRIYGGEASDFEVKSNALKVLEAAKVEFCRRVLAPYEDEKIRINGEVT